MKIRTLRNVKKIAIVMAVTIFTLVGLFANAETASARNVKVTVGSHHAQGYSIVATSVQNSGKYTAGNTQTVNLPANGRVLVGFSIRVRSWWGGQAYKQGAVWCWVDNRTNSLYI